MLPHVCSILRPLSLRGVWVPDVSAGQLKLLAEMPRHFDPVPTKFLSQESLHVCIACLVFGTRERRQCLTRPRTRTLGPTWDDELCLRLRCHRLWG